MVDSPLPDEHRCEEPILRLSPTPKIVIVKEITGALLEPKVGLVGVHELETALALQIT